MTCDWFRSRKFLIAKIVELRAENLKLMDRLNKCTAELDEGAKVINQASAAIEELQERQRPKSIEREDT